MGIGYQKEIDTNEQTQTSPPFGYIIQTYDKEDITLESPISEDDETITLSTGHGFTGIDGEHILIYENDHFLQQRIGAGQISGDTITLKLKADISFSTAAKVIRGNTDLTKDFSGANAKELYLKILNGSIPIDMKLMILSFQSSAEPDDATFGGIAALTNGLYIRQVNSLNRNLGNYGKNQSFRMRGADIKYEEKGAGKIYSTTIIFNLRESFDNQIRLDPRINEYILIGLRDNFSTLDLFHISFTGSYTKGE